MPFSSRKRLPLAFRAGNKPDSFSANGPKSFFQIFDDIINILYTDR